MLTVPVVLQESLSSELNKLTTFNFSDRTGTDIFSMIWQWVIGEFNFFYK